MGPVGAWFTEAGGIWARMVWRGAWLVRVTEVGIGVRVQAQEKGWAQSSGWEAGRQGENGGVRARE